jgi:hypothetical protein
MLISWLSARPSFVTLGAVTSEQQGLILDLKIFLTSVLKKKRRLYRRSKDSLRHADEETQALKGRLISFGQEISDLRGEVESPQKLCSAYYARPLARQHYRDRKLDARPMQSIPNGRGWKSGKSAACREHMFRLGNQRKFRCGMRNCVS